MGGGVAVRARVGSHDPARGGRLARSAGWMRRGRIGYSPVRGGRLARSAGWMRRGRIGYCCPIGPVVLRGHAADEARRAVTALRPAADSHLALHGVQGAGAAEPFGRDHLLAVERQRRHEAGVECGPSRAARSIRRSDVRPRDQHGAGAALALGAALLGAGQALVAQPVERGDVRLDTGDSPLLTVHGDGRGGHSSCPLSCPGAARGPSGSGSRRPRAGRTGAWRSWRSRSLRSCAPGSASC